MEDLGKRGAKVRLEELYREAVTARMEEGELVVMVVAWTSPSVLEINAGREYQTHEIEH